MGKKTIEMNDTKLLYKFGCRAFEILKIELNNRKRKHEIQSFY